MNKFDSIIEKQMSKIKKGHEFGTVGTGKSGPMPSKKQKGKSSQRRDWKKQEKSGVYEDHNPNKYDRDIDGVPFKLISDVKVVNAVDVADKANIIVPDEYLDELPAWAQDANIAEHYTKFLYKMYTWADRNDAHVFQAGKEESGYFPLGRGIREAIKSGKGIVVYVNLS